MEFKDYYATLGLAKDADQKSIKQAYRRLARKHHPDVNPGDKSAEERFKDISEAYEVLSDPAKRKKYDQFGSQWKHAPEGVDFSEFAQGFGGFGGQRINIDLGGDFSDFFNMLFGEDIMRGAAGFRAGGARPRITQSQDVEVEMEITLEDAFRGTSKKFSLDLQDVCEACSGRGHTGSGPCPACRGTARAAGTRRLEVKIPRGVNTGSRIRLGGQGTGLKGSKGNLYIKLRVRPHPLFERRGDDLYVDLKVPLKTAALGGDVSVPTLDKPVRMKIPPGTQGGRVMRLRGLGMPRMRGSGKGDLYARVQIHVPTELTAEQSRALKDLF
jgi:molecular chaperone DnaJ